MVGAELDPHDAAAVEDKVVEYHQTIAYVLFGALAPSPFPSCLVDLTRNGCANRLQG